MQSQNTAAPCSFCDDADAPAQPSGHCHVCEKCTARLEGYEDAERDIAMLEVERVVRRALDTAPPSGVRRWVAAALAPNVVTATMSALIGTDDHGAGT